MRRLLRHLAGSVRVRVTATALLAVAAALGVSTGVLYAGLQHDRQNILRSTAGQRAKDFLALNPTLQPPLVVPAEATIDTGLVQVLVKGQVAGSSRALRSYPSMWAPGQARISPAPPAFTLAEDVWVVAMPVHVGARSATVVVVTSLAQFDDSVAGLTRLLYLGAPALLVVVGVICWLIVGRALRPIERMRREVAEVAGVTGGHRVAQPPHDDEVGRLARTLNSMLDRIERSAERERRFISDASHELRSPIANIRTELEVALHRPGAADWAQVAGTVLAENGRMEQLVAGLLLLARSDEGSLPVAAEPVDLAVVARAAAGSVPVPVEVRAAAAPVSVPEIYLERIVVNLLDNARRFAATKVVLTVGPESTQAVLRVRDDGPGVPAELRERIFERFVRLDEARNREDGGFGLGLAIVADLARFYGGSIDVGDAAPGAEFVMRLPLASPVAPAGPVPADPVPAGHGRL